MHESDSDIDSDPIQLEEAFRGLLIRLAHSGTDSRYIRDIDAFLKQFASITALRSFLPSYLLELTPCLDTIAESFNPAGFSTEELSEIGARLQNVQQLLIPAEKSETLNGIVVRFQSALASMYAALGEDKEAFQVINVQNSGSPRENVSTEPVEHLKAFVSALNVSNTTYFSGLSDILSDWKNASSDSETTGYMVVIDPGTHEKWGYLRSFSVEIEARANEDTFRLFAPSTGNDQNGSSALRAPVAAARTLIKELAPSISNTFLRGSIRLEADSVVHSGHSGDLTIASLIVCAAISFTEQRHVYKIRKGVLLTGDLDRDGCVLPIDDTSLRSKVRTVFFSWATRMVVPLHQLGRAREEVRLLSRDHPYRALEVTGIEHLKDIFTDRRITNDEYVDLSRHFVRKASRYRVEILFSTAIAVLLILLATVMYGPLDRNPEYYELDDGGFTVFNRKNQELDRIALNPMTVRKAVDPAQQLIVLRDIDGDGVKEIVWGELSNHRTGTPSVLKWKNAGEDSSMFEMELNVPLDYTRDVSIIQSRFEPNFVEATDLEGDGRSDILVNLRHNEYYPDVLLRLDALTGQITGRYDHSGIFMHTMIVDLNGDGIQEIMLTGANNAFRRALIAVLDSRMLWGQGPSRGDYRTGSDVPGSEIFYAILPTTELGRVAPPSVRTGTQLRLSYEDKLIDTTILDVFARIENIPIREGRYHVVFDYSLKPLSIGTDSQFDEIYSTYLKRGLLTEPFDNMAKLKMLNEFQYWDGTEWTNEYTMNRRNIAIRDSLDRIAAEPDTRRGSDSAN